MAATRLLGRTSGWIAVLAAGCLVTGCTGSSSEDTACPAIGWSNTLVVPRVDDGATVEVCVGGTCVRPADLTRDEVPSPPFLGVTTVGSGWELELIGASDAVRVRRSDPAGTVLSDRTVHPRWSRTGGTEECGGPQRAVLPQ